jgi:hypothetical protein
LAIKIAQDLDLAHLLKLRLAVGRFGEMDCARWWNTLGVLGPRGDAVMQRGFLHTHRFAQARIVFAVASARCGEVFSAPRSTTLWSLPPELEDELEERWQHWLDQAIDRDAFFASISAAPKTDLLEFLVQLSLITPEQSVRATGLKRSHEGRAVQLEPQRVISDDVLSTLAAGFARGDVGKLAVPFVILEGNE